MKQDKQKKPTQGKGQSKIQNKVQQKKKTMTPSYLEKRKKRFITFWGVFFALGFFTSSVYVIRMVNAGRIPASFQFIISIIRVLDVFLLAASPIYAALIYYSYIKGRVASKKAFNIRFLFAVVLFIYSVVIFFGLR